MNLLLVFLLTFVIELIVFFIFIKEQKLKIALYCFLINAFTWPLANIVYSLYGFFWFIEAGVIIIESALVILLLKITWEKALIVSLIGNLITAILSFLL